jgi:hypothetical protein
MERMEIIVIFSMPSPCSMVNFVETKSCNEAMRQ